MSRKDFVALAEAIKGVSDTQERARVARLIADVCAARNGNFDRGRFYYACGVEY